MDFYHVEIVLETERFFDSTEQRTINKLVYATSGESAISAAQLDIDLTYTYDRIDSQSAQKLNLQKVFDLNQEKVVF